MIDYQKQVIEQIKEKIEQKDLEGALLICEDSQYTHWSPVQSLRFELLKIMGRTNEIYDICCQKEYQNDIDMISRRIKIMMNRGQEEEALLLCNQYPSHYLIQSQKMCILTKKGRFDDAILVSENPYLMHHPSILLQRNKALTLKFRNQQKKVTVIER